jgi:hypothetical protein
MRLHGVRPLPFALLAAAVLAVGPVLSAQDPRSSVPPSDVDEWSGAVPAHVAVVDGVARLERDGRVEPLDENMVVVEGDRLETDRGRVEVLFADGSALDLDEYTTIDVQSDALLRLIAGRVRWALARARTDAVRVDAAAGSATLRGGGEYRLAIVGDDTREGDLVVTALRGSAEVENRFGRSLARAGTEVVSSVRRAPSMPAYTNSALYDPFARWYEAVADARLRTASGRYLPDELRLYGSAFDRDGSWEYAPTYGYVWYPRVAAPWRPYWQGRWSFGARVGWFWVGVERWTWPTHHYGRWGLSGSRWFWIPDRRWSPAWVSWATAPGYVSWCPLGWDNRPVIGLGYDRHVWPAWTVIPARVFAPNVRVDHYVVSTPIAPDVRSQFVTRRAAPDVPGVVPSSVRPPRSSLPVRGYAVPRESAEPAAAPAGRDDARRVQAPREAPRPESSRFEVPRIEAPRIDAPRVATPRVQPPAGPVREPSRSWRAGAPDPAFQPPAPVPSARPRRSVPEAPRVDGPRPYEPPQVDRSQPDRSPRVDRNRGPEPSQRESGGSAESRRAAPRAPAGSLPAPGQAPARVAPPRSAPPSSSGESSRPAPSGGTGRGGQAVPRRGGGR